MYGVIINHAIPPEVYDKGHAELSRTVGPTVDGLILHLARATEEGIQVVDVWESKERFAAFDYDLVYRQMAELSGSDQLLPPPRTEEFEVRGLVIPRADVLI